MKAQGMARGKGRGSRSGDAPRELSPAVVGTLAGLAAVAAAAALWSVYLWWQLLQVRAGATAVCAFGGTSCAEVWDAPFASAVHRFSGVPVAGWGVIWGLAALALPLAALVVALRGGAASAWRGGIRLLAVSGVSGVVALLGVSLWLGSFCSSCAVFYALVGVYALVALLRLSDPGDKVAGRGALLALTSLAAAWAVVLVPGLRTPAAGAASATLERGENRLESFLASLDPAMAQGISGSLAAFRSAPPLPQEAPRALLGEASAPVRITEFSDVLCSHCATLHQTLEVLWRSAPPGSFSVDSRQFPLDGRCNPQLAPRDGGEVRCAGALARICFEGREGREEVSARLFEHQRELTVEMIFELAEPFLDRAALEACMESPETRAKLDQDLAYARRYNPPGTPLVLVDGRLANAFGPFLYALVLAGGDAADPAFEVLPAPSRGGSGR